MTPQESKNIQAFLRVIRAGESLQTDIAYRMLNGGGVFESFADHPYANQSAPPGRAAGAYQFIPHTWTYAARLAGAGDFSPESQDKAAISLIEAKDSLEMVKKGDIVPAIAKLAGTWISLPGLGPRANQVFAEYGGKRIAGAVAEGEATVPVQTGEKPMPALALLQIFGPMLASLIPQISAFFKPESEVAKRNVGLAETILSTITSTAGTDSLEKAITVMQADPAVKQKVQEAVVTHPDILPALQIVEVGGGPAAAAERDLKAAIADVPFYKNSAVFWVTAMLMPMVYIYILSSVAGGVEIPEGWPWYAQLPLKIFGKEWDDGARVGLANLVIGLVLGGICGVYYGVSVTQAKQASQASQDKKDTA